MAEVHLPGSHVLSLDGATEYIQYLLDMPDSWSMRLAVYPEFEYDTADDPMVFEWYFDADNYVKFFYDHTADKFTFEASVGGVLDSILSEQFDDGSSHTDIGQWLIFDIVYDLVGTSAMYVDRGTPTAWSAAGPSAQVKNLPIWTVGVDNALTGDFFEGQVAYIRLFSDYEATAADIANDFEDVSIEEIMWNFNGNVVGRTRCNVSEHVISYNTRAAQETGFGAPVANSMSVSLHNENGRFSDDQYAAFSPDDAQYNGTVLQKYLQLNSRIELESWYDGDFDWVFFGILTDDLYSRATDMNFESVVSISANDPIGMLVRDQLEYSKMWEDKDLCDTADETNSLVHLLLAEMLDREVKNYAGNSGFENATIANSWIDTGDCTLSRDGTYSLFGDYSGKAVFTDAGSFYQRLDFDENEFQVNEDDYWSASIYVFATAAFTGTLTIEEHDSVGMNDSTSAIISHDGTEGWIKVSVTHKITDSDSDRLYLELDAAAASTVWVDAVMWVFSSEASDWHFLNDTDGTVGVMDASDAEEDSYTLFGVDAENFDVQHPWVFLAKGTNQWNELQDMAVAMISRYFGFDRSGTFRFRTNISGNDPNVLETISTPKELSTSIELERANKIEANGVSILKSTSNIILWQASASGAIESDVQDKAALLHIEISPGETVPNPTTYGDFFARYQL